MYLLYQILPTLVFSPESLQYKVESLEAKVMTKVSERALFKILYKYISLSKIRRIFLDRERYFV